MQYALLPGIRSWQGSTNSDNREVWKDRDCDIEAEYARWGNVYENPN